MVDGARFRTADEWRIALGFLPITLRATDEDQAQFVMMNGSTGNFCLDFSGGIDQTAQRAAAWSCDVGHYVTCLENHVIVNHWASDKREERFSWKSVVAHIHEFHQHLEAATSDRSKSIVAHTLTIFRRIRAVESDGISSLKIFLHLLAAATDGRDRLDAKGLADWGLSPDTAEVSAVVNEATWRPLYNDLVGLGRYAVLNPDFHLVLRHASGDIFEDAHLQTVSSNAPWLPGLEHPAQIDPTSEPTEHGAHFTPRAIARTLAEEVSRVVACVEGRTLVLFDPACGSGELLRECLRLLKRNKYSGKLRVIGWDKSPAAVTMAQFVLAWERRAWLSGQLETEIILTDSASAQAWPTEVDVLVMNPPFKSWEKMNAQEQDVVKGILGPSSKPNFAMAFARRALDALRSGGVLAMIAPGSLLEGNSGQDTRQEMATAFNPQLVGKLGDQNAFSRALVDAGMYVGVRKPCNVGKAAILWADSRPKSMNQALRALRKWRDADSEPLSGDGFSVYLNGDIALDGNPWLARGYDAWSLYARFQQSARMLPANTIFDIRQGIRLGNDVFIVSSDYFEALGKSEQKFFRPAVMNPSISDGCLKKSYYSFYPYTTGLPPIKTEVELERHVPKYFRDYLSPAMRSLKSRKTLAAQPESKWWDLLRPRGWQAGPSPKLVSKYFGGRRSFAFDSTGDFVVVVGNAWIIKKGQIDVEVNPDDEAYFAATEDEVCLAFLAYLNSSVAYGLLEYLSVQVSGGQLDLSNKYVGKLPLPDLAKLGYRELKELIELGSAISNGESEVWSEIDNRVIDILGR